MKLIESRLLLFIVTKFAIFTLDIGTKNNESIQTNFIFLKSSFFRYIYGEYEYLLIFNGFQTDRDHLLDKIYWQFRQTLLKFRRTLNRS